MTPEQKKTYRDIVDSACHVDDVRVSAWLRQTDLFKQVHIAAAMIAIYGERAVFIDGRIDQRLTEQATGYSTIKGFFNRRFHDKGIHWPRLIYFQTIATRKWSGGPRKRGVANLHFHGLIVIPERQTSKQIKAKLGEVFGVVPKMGGKIQFAISQPDWTKRYTFNDVTAFGPVGKLLYVQEGMGGTYNDLELNEDGKRSRKAPIQRLRCNRHASGLAKGMPSHFNAKATLCDQASTSAGRRAFEEWLAEGRLLQKETERRLVREQRLAVLTSAAPVQEYDHCAKALIS